MYKVKIAFFKESCDVAARSVVKVIGIADDHLGEFTEISALELHLCMIAKILTAHLTPDLNRLGRASGQVRLE